MLYYITVNSHVFLVKGKKKSLIILKHMASFATSPDGKTTSGWICLKCTSKALLSPKDKKHVYYHLAVQGQRSHF